MEAGNSALQLGPIPPCIGLFKQEFGIDATAVRLSLNSEVTDHPFVRFVGWVSSRSELAVDEKSYAARQGGPPG